MFYEKKCILIFLHSSTQLSCDYTANSIGTLWLLGIKFNLFCSSSRESDNIHCDKNIASYKLSFKKIF